MILLDQCYYSLNNIDLYTKKIEAGKYKILTHTYFPVSIFNVCTVFFCLYSFGKAEIHFSSPKNQGILFFIKDPTQMDFDFFENCNVSKHIG